MGHSYVEFAGNAKQFKDSDLLVITQLVMREWDSQGGDKVFPSLLPLIDQWNQSLEVYAPGCIDIELDSFIETREQSESLVKLLGFCCDRLREFEPVVPGEYLTELVGAPDVLIYSDRKTSELVSLFESFTEVVRGKQWLP